MPRVRFEPTTPVSERAKTVLAIDSAATVLGKEKHFQLKISPLFSDQTTAADENQFKFSKFRLQNKTKAYSTYCFILLFDSSDRSDIGNLFPCYLQKACLGLMTQG
jgi:hypothetical protein